MKKYLSFALLTISIFSLNILPAKAATKNSKSTKAHDHSHVISGGQWCLALPWLGLFCLDL